MNIWPGQLARSRCRDRPSGAFIDDAQAKLSALGADCSVLFGCLHGAATIALAGGFWDIALRDFGLLLAALALGQLARDRA